MKFSATSSIAMITLACTVNLGLCGLAWSETGQSDESDGLTARQIFSTDLESVSVVQEKIYDRDHEIGVLFGYIPDDDFHQSFPLGANYIYHFDDHFAWEVRGQWSFNTNRDIRDQLVEEYAVEPEEFDELQYLLHTSLVIKPTYGKDSIWNAGILNHEGYMSVGVGFAGYKRDYSFGPSTTERALSLAFGIGRKYFISQSFSLNLEVRDYLIFKNEATENNVYLGLGLAYRFNMEARKAPSEHEDHSIYRYLRNDHEAQ